MLSIKKDRHAIIHATQLSLTKSYGLRNLHSCLYLVPRPRVLWQNISWSMNKRGQHLQYLLIISISSSFTTHCYRICLVRPSTRGRMHPQPTSGRLASPQQVVWEQDNWVEWFAWMWSSKSTDPCAPPMVYGSIDLTSRDNRRCSQESCSSMVSQVLWRQTWAQWSLVSCVFSLGGSTEDPTRYLHLPHPPVSFPPFSVYNGNGRTRVVEESYLPAVLCRGSSATRLERRCQRQLRLSFPDGDDNDSAWFLNGSCRGCWQGPQRSEERSPSVMHCVVND